MFHCLFGQFNVQCNAKFHLQRNKPTTEGFTWIHMPTLFTQLYTTLLHSIATLHPQVGCGHNAGSPGGFRGEPGRSRNDRPKQEGLLQEELQCQTHHIRRQNQVRLSSVLIAEWDV